MTSQDIPPAAAPPSQAHGPHEDAPDALSRRYAQGMEYLVSVVQQLSLARSLEALTAIVRKAARKLTGADGATFILREGDRAYYADEDAIAPLWKGRRFPMSACISGWAMLNRASAVIEDIYADPRIPADAYRPTFVKSLVMVPIRTVDPVGAIGCYWARPHHAGAEEVRLLQALADSASVAMENIRLYAELDRRIEERTAHLETALREIESFTYAVSHDLRAPLRSVEGFSRALLEDHAARLDDEGRDYLARTRAAALRMDALIDDLLRLSQTTRCEIRNERADLSAIARDVVRGLAQAHPRRDVQAVIADDVQAAGDARLLRIMLENLFDNAWKFTAGTAQAVVEFGVLEHEADGRVYFMRDNGAGFDAAHADKIFEPFRRLHPESEFPGNGIGLATVQRIVHRHGGRIHAESHPGRGATFYWTLPQS